MPSGGSGGGGGGAGGGTRSREVKPKGLSKGAQKHQEELANKAPSGRELKIMEKKAAAKERKAERAENEDYQQQKQQFQDNKAKGKAVNAYEGGKGRKVENW